MKYSNLPEYKDDTSLQYIKSIKNNLLQYMQANSLTIREMAEKANVSLSTLNKILYLEERDCKLSTAAALASTLEVSINDLIDIDVPDKRLQYYISSCKKLPRRAILLILWFIRHQIEMHSDKSAIQNPKVISVMEPIVTNDGLSKTSDTFRTVDISYIPDDLRHKIFFGILIVHDMFMPRYAPGDILLIANDRNPFPRERVVVAVKDNLFLTDLKVENGVKKFYGIMDGRYKCDENDVSEVLGYVVQVIHGEE